MHERDMRRKGLIPAHAGKTFTSATGSAETRAHPRSRGENMTLPGCTCSRMGSSPLTRGKRGGAVRVSGYGGLIPAHAGKTMSRRRPMRSLTAHPRSRGENIITNTGQASTAGSSPLTRGKRLSTARDLGRPRLIPAHAGKTFLRASPRSPEAAHPRSRGENIE